MECITQTKCNNWVDGFVDFEDDSYLVTDSPIITIGNETAAYITHGLDGFIDNDTELLNTSYFIVTIGNETAEPFVQDFPFYTGTKVNILTPKIFADTVGFAVSRDDSDSQDWDFMAEYMRNIEDNLYLQYLQHKLSEQ